MANQPIHAAVEAIRDGTLADRARSGAGLETTRWMDAAEKNHAAAMDLLGSGVSAAC